MVLLHLLLLLLLRFVIFFSVSAGVLNLNKYRVYVWVVFYFVRILLICVFIFVFDMHKYLVYGSMIKIVETGRPQTWTKWKDCSLFRNFVKIFVLRANTFWKLFRRNGIDAPNTRNFIHTWVLCEWQRIIEQNFHRQHTIFTIAYHCPCATYSI